MPVRALRWPTVDGEAHREKIRHVAAAAATELDSSDHLGVRQEGGESGGGGGVSTGLSAEATPVTKPRGVGMTWARVGGWQNLSLGGWAA